MKYEAINFADKFAKFEDQWAPKVIARMNDYHFKLVRLEGDFARHIHKDTDEVFVVMDGSLRIDLQDGEVVLNKGEMFVVPKGLEHKPHAEHECQIMLIEPMGTISTGEAGEELKVEDDVWI
jgi:mannose-6-phosphate isomerase-like protein (cupin superfamily)